MKHWQQRLPSPSVIHCTDCIRWVGRSIGAVHPTYDLVARICALFADGWLVFYIVHAVAFMAGRLRTNGIPMRNVGENFAILVWGDEGLTMD